MYSMYICTHAYMGIMHVMGQHVSEHWRFIIDEVAKVKLYITHPSIRIILVPGSIFYMFIIFNFSCLFKQLKV